jgi:pilus assembly protein FimV
LPAAPAAVAPAAAAPASAAPTAASPSSEPSSVAPAAGDKTAAAKPTGRPRAVSRDDSITAAKESNDASMNKAGEVTITKGANKAMTKGANKALPNGGDAGAASSVTVSKGQSLAKIAAQVKDDDVALDRAMLAIFRANPNAFFGSIHQLKADVTLSVPSRETMLSQTDRFIASEMRRHTEVFQTYKARAAGSPALASTEGPTAQTREGGSAGSSPKYDRLVLTKSTGSQAAAEQQAAVDTALKEARSRVADLERNLGDLNKLAELKDRQIAQATATLKRLSQDTTAKPASNQASLAPASAVSSVTGNSLTTGPGAADVTAATTAAATTEAATAATTAAAATATPPAGNGAAADSSSMVATAATAAKTAATELTKLPPVAAAPRRTEVATQPSWFDSIPPYLLYALIGLVAAVGLWFGKRWKDQRAPKDRFDKMVAQHSMFDSETNESYFTHRPKSPRPSRLRSRPDRGRCVHRFRSKTPPTAPADCASNRPCPETIQSVARAGRRASSPRSTPASCTASIDRARRCRLQTADDAPAASDGQSAPCTTADRRASRLRTNKTCHANRPATAGAAGESP